MTKTDRSAKPRSLPVDRWPGADRDAWAKACSPGKRFERGGLASHMKPESRDDLAGRYGAFLGFLERSGRLDLKADAGALVTPQNVAPYLEDLRTRVASVTCYCCIHKLRRIAEILDPRRNFIWLSEIEKDLNFCKVPSPKHHRIMSSHILVEAGLALFEQAEISSTTIPNRARMARNGLMIALLALCPIRLRAFAGLTIGRNFVMVGEDWWIVLTGAETKSGRPDERPVPKLLTPYVATYIARWHPEFQAEGTALWPSRRRRPMSSAAIYHTICKTTRELTGTAVNPHLFRSCVVATNARLAGDQMGMSTALLQHTDRRVTEEYYNKGRSVGAANKFREIIDLLSTQ